MSTMATSSDRPLAETRPTGTNFLGLVGVELRRLWWRRFTKVALVVMVVFIGVATYGLSEQLRPESIAQQLDSYEAVVAEMNKVSPADQAAQIAQCRTDNPGQDYCETMFQLPSPDDFGLQNVARATVLQSLALIIVYLLGLLAFLLGASFVSNEYATGNMGSWLTFVPQRVKVALSKLTAALIGGLGIGAVGVGLAAISATLLTTFNRPDAAVQRRLDTVLAAAPGPSVTDTLIRVVLVVGLGGLGGAILAFLVRNTAGVLGLTLGFIVIVEGFIANTMGGGHYQKWLPRLNLEAFIHNGSEYTGRVCETVNACSMTRLPHSFTFSWVYLLIFTLALGTIAVLVFRRRDVT